MTERMADTRLFYRDMIIALWHPDVTRPMAYLRRRHKQEWSV